MKLHNVYMAEENGGEGGSSGGGDVKVSVDESKSGPAPSAQASEVSKEVSSDVKVDSKQNWPDNWQELVSKGDEKRASHVKRYASPEAMADALIAAQNRIRSGELRAPLPENPTKEELNAWRKDNGIPETPDKYDLKFDDGLVVGNEDRGIIDEYLKQAHETNMAPDQVKKTVSWFFKERENQAALRSQKDDADRIQAIDALTVEWGKNFNKNRNLVSGVLDKFPPDVKDALIAARMPDGRGVFNHPEVMRGFLAMALENNPAGIIAPAGGGDINKSAIDEYQELQSVMKNNRKGYDKDSGKQTRMRELIAHLSKAGLIDNAGNVVQRK